MLPAEMQIKYIDNNEGLKQACEALSTAELVAVDTEFHRETTFYPIASLIQLFASDLVYIVDCFEVDDWKPLIQLFENQQVIKVLHSCSEDLEVFQCLFQTLPSPVIDTQLAAAMVGKGFSIGYRGLILGLFDIEVDKEQTRSDWLRRPLSERQIQYAAIDVFWLPAAWLKLKSELEEKGRLSWCEQDCSKLIRREDIEADDSLNFYKRLRGIWRLNSSELNLVRALCAWREKQAQQDNVPRGRILSDGNIIELSKRAPVLKEQFDEIDGIRSTTRSQFAQVICKLIEKQLSTNPESWPGKLLDRTAPAFKTQLKSLKNLVEAEAEALDLPPELLGRKKELEKYIENPGSSEITSGWRAALLNEKLDHLNL